MKRFFWLMIGLMVVLTGCAKPRVVSNPSSEYDSMGTLEERIDVHHQILRYVTLGLLQKHSYKNLTKRLNKKLEHKARQKYGADAVANVTYWPDPKSDAIVDYLYGRGEMIRYKKFGSPESGAAANTAPSQ